jgi:thiol-disulfide isomerase/thioredoxin
MRAQPFASTPPFAPRLVSTPLLASRLVAWILALAATVVATACKTPGDAAPEPAPLATAASRAPSAARRMRATDAPPKGDVDALVRAAVTAATAEKRRVVVYVGAPWCEPCQRFHHAVERGDLDGTFPDVDLLTFDADRDSERLASAGYVSKLIPLLALPGPDGRASGKQVEGGIKGEGAVGYIAPRLQQMLAD